MEENKETALREFEGKNIAHYSVLLGEWFQTKLEYDKTLLTLSSGGIGLLITILTTVGANNWCELAFFGAAFLCFGICIWSSLKIFKLNSQHIEREIKKKDSSDLKLERYDNLSAITFLLGIFSFCLIGLSAAIEDFNSKEVIEMANGKNTELPDLGKSYSGLSELRPEPPINPAPQETPQQQDSSQSGPSGNSEGGEKK